MINGQARLVFLDQHERGAGDDPGVLDSQAFRDRTRQLGFAGPERAGQANHRSRKKQLSQAVSECTCCIETAKICMEFMLAGEGLAVHATRSLSSRRSSSCARVLPCSAGTPG